MKPTAIIINMARGPIWVESDVVKALAAGQIAGAGADVFEQEPVTIDNPLFQFDNFVGTPHMSAHTEESMIKMSLVAEDVLGSIRRTPTKIPGRSLKPEFLKFIKGDHCGISDHIKRSL